MTQRDRQRAWYYQELETRFPGQGLAEKIAVPLGTGIGV